MTCYLTGLRGRFTLLWTSLVGIEISKLFPLTPVPPSDAPPADQSDPAPALTETAPVLLPLVHDGKLHPASAGHFIIGWRVYADWSVKLQALGGGALQDKAISPSAWPRATSPKSR